MITNLLPHKLVLWFRNQQGQDAHDDLVIEPNSRLRFGNFRDGKNDYLLSEVDTFPKLPVITTMVATSDQFFLVAGTNAVSADVTNSTKGGIVLAAHGADNDQTLLAAGSDNRFHLRMSATSRIRFETQIALNQVLLQFSSFGLNENVTDPNPAGTAGDGAMFLADPSNELTATTGATAAQAANWILCHKVNGADTFTFTTVPVTTQDVVLAIEIGTDLIADYYINNVLVGSGPALTSGDSVKAFAGIQAGAGAVKSVDVRYIMAGRAIG